MRLVPTALLGGAAFAQTPAKDRSDTNVAVHRDGEWRSSKLIGVDVYNDANEKIGAIEELIVDKSSKVENVILGVGGFLGMRKHLVTVKFENLKWVTTSGSATAPNSGGTTYTMYPDHAVLNATKDQLKSMPEFSAAAES